MERAPERDGGTERELLLGWLAFHRSALAGDFDNLRVDMVEPLFERANSDMQAYER